jgi:phosphoglycolate phosphatase-like HAD superfamily hydrolase
VTVVLLWDVDGTLLTTARAGVYALEEAAAEVLGVEVDLQGLATAGLTDAEVAALVLRTGGGSGDEPTVRAFLASYERRLPAALHRRKGRVLPGVRAVLDDLAGRDDVLSLLLTGNTPAGAAAKLGHYGLDGYFPDGAFCVGPGPREEIARRALALANGASTVYVIGDTPYDVRAGRAVGARTVAVASGSYSAAELRAEEPWTVLERLPEPPRFRALLGIDR